jgi:hypothetical protein
MRKEKHRVADAIPALSTTPLVATDHNRHRPRNGSWHEPVTAEDRYEAWVLAEAERLGYRLSLRCVRCNQPLVAAKSVALHMGPVCRARTAEQ